MTPDDLIAQARRKREGPVDPDGLSPLALSAILSAALGLLLQAIDYESDPASSGARAARILAVVISGCDEVAAKQSS